MRIASVSNEVQKIAEGGLKGPGKSPSDSFANELKAGIQSVNQLQNQAESAMQSESVSGATNIHETMLKLEEADVSFRLLTRVRNKALDAYHEMMRMQF
jgi:flagellar hook-basal body complex protein FliE